MGWEKPCPGPINTSKATRGAPGVPSWGDRKPPIPAWWLRDQGWHGWEGDKPTWAEPPEEKRPALLPRFGPTKYSEAQLMEATSDYLQRKRPYSHRHQALAMRGSQEAEALLALANDKVAQPRTLFSARKKSVRSPSHGQRDADYLKSSTTLLEGAGSQPGVGGAESGSDRAAAAGPGPIRQARAELSGQWNGFAAAARERG